MRVKTQCTQNRTNTPKAIKIVQNAPMCEAQIKWELYISYQMYTGPAVTTYLLNDEVLYNLFYLIFKTDVQL